MRFSRAAPCSSRRADAVSPLRRAGLARAGAIARRPRVPEPPDPLTLDHRLAVTDALRLLAVHGQALAFVASAGAHTGVVSAEDLRFAADWAGPRATVAHAVTQALVDLAANESNPIPIHLEEP